MFAVILMWPSYEKHGLMLVISVTLVVVFAYVMGNRVGRKHEGGEP